MLYLLPTEPLIFPTIVGEEVENKLIKKCSSLGLSLFAVNDVVGWSIV